MSPLSEKVAIVTGAGRGLGRAMALGLADAGVRVLALAARESQEIDALAAANEGILPHIADVTREEDCRAAVDAALARFSRLDILINNAGRGMKYVSESFMTEPTRFWEVKPETWRLVIDTNVNGPFLMTRAAVPHLRAAGWGRIVNISVGNETMRRRGFSPYGPSPSDAPGCSSPRSWCRHSFICARRKRTALPACASTRGCGAPNCRPPKRRSPRARTRAGPDRTASFASSRARARRRIRPASSQERDASPSRDREASPQSLPEN
jgi:hypothetical protein